MLTITSQEYSELLVSSEKILVDKAKKALSDLKKGRDISDVFLTLCSANANLQAIKHYRTGKFDPSEYYNNVSPLQISGMYSNINTLTK